MISNCSQIWTIENLSLEKKVSRTRKSVERSRLSPRRISMLRYLEKKNRKLRTERDSSHLRVDYSAIKPKRILILTLLINVNLSSPFFNAAMRVKWRKKKGKKYKQTILRSGKNLRVNERQSHWIEKFNKDLHGQIRTVLRGRFLRGTENLSRTRNIFVRCD